MRPCYLCDRKPGALRLSGGVPVCSDCARAHRLSQPTVAVRTPIPDEKTDPGVSPFMGFIGGYGL